MAEPRPSRKSKAAALAGLRNLSGRRQPPAETEEEPMNESAEGAQWVHRDHNVAGLNSKIYSPGLFAPALTDAKCILYSTGIFTCYQCTIPRFLNLQNLPVLYSLFSISQF